MRSRSSVCRLLSAFAVGAFAACTGDYADLVPKTVDEDPALPSLELSGTRFHLETFGTPGNPVVIVLHGGPGADHRSLLPLAALADDGFFVVLWDQRGTGLSRRHPCEELTADAYLRDVEAIVDHFARSPSDRVSMVGHSWGAMYATWYTNEHPERVGPLVLAEPGAFTRAGLDDYFNRFMGSADLTGESFNDSALLARILTPDDHARADFDMAQSSTIITGPLGLDPEHPEPFWRFGAVVSSCLADTAGNFDWTTNLSRYTGDALFIHGERNQVHTVEHQQALAAFYPRAEVVTIPGVGHDMFSAAPAASLDLVRSHLLEVQP
ncbi:MAG TPA: alpha/beta hydrolase [Myxococcaceae bacterium]|nr:alpha/beta hydrolase [Myxococcaceae bacterium]